MIETLLLLTLTLVQVSTPSPSPAASNASTPLTFWAQIFAISGVVIAFLTFVFTQMWPRIQTRLDRRSLQKRIGAQSYTPDSIERSLRYFVAPQCQDIDPAGGEEPRKVYGVKQKLYDALDDALANPTSYKYLILLADSGMGKTTALLNYYVKHLRKWRKPDYKLALVPLSNASADDQIEAIEDKSNTVLLLDALDEDTLAVVDYKERLRLLLKATSPFRTIVMSCRTQFFSRDEEIPKQTGILKVSARAAGEEAEYYFHKIYLSPFSDEQVNKYIRRRYPFWRMEQRRRARRLVTKIPHLTVRPMLLAHVDDLIRTKGDYRYSYELYAAMVKAWIDRERGFIDDADALNKFSERLAVDIYVNRFTRKSERIPKAEIQPLTKEWGIALEEWRLTGRSLLNRDAEGNFKFAHRSIMEYLFVRSFMAGNTICATVEWTDQMKSFLWEVVQEQMLLAEENGVAPDFWQNSSWLNGEALAPFCEIVADQLGEIVAARQRNFFVTVRSRMIFLTIAALCAFIVNPSRKGRTLVSLFAFVDPTLRSKSVEHVFSFWQAGQSDDYIRALHTLPEPVDVPAKLFETIGGDDLSPVHFDYLHTWFIIAPPNFAPLGLLAFRAINADRDLSTLQTAIEKAGWNKSWQEEQILRKS